MDVGKPEKGLARTADTLERFSEMAQEGYADFEAAPRGSERKSELLSFLLNVKSQNGKKQTGDPSKASSVVFGLRKETSDRLQFGVREHGTKEPEDGIFWTPLHQEVVTIDDYAADSPAATQAKALLFIDTTPGEDGGTAFLHPLFPLEPELTESQKTVSSHSSQADETVLRAQVKSQLDAIRQADRVEDSRPRNDSWVHDTFYTFYQGDKKTAVLRLGLGEGDRSSRKPIPGIKEMESTGTVSFAQQPDQEYAEQISLNGEERKALLATLASLDNATPDLPEGQLNEEQYAQLLSKERLEAATETLSALVADGDLGFYEQLVSDLNISSSWLARLKSGEKPSRAF